MRPGSGRLARVSSAVACARCGGSGIDPGPVVDIEGAGGRTAAEVLYEKINRLRPGALDELFGEGETGT